jgi:hypothetical protein
MTPRAMVNRALLWANAVPERKTIKIRSQILIGVEKLFWPGQ